MFNATHIVPSVGPSAFGLAAVVLNLAKAQIALGWDARIWSLDAPLELRPVASENGLPRNCLVGFGQRGPAFLRYSPQMNREARDCSRTDVLHQHGIWTMLSRVTNGWRSAHDRPTVICAHGSLEPWALRRSRWKKRLAMWGYEAENLRRATCLHALGPNEVSAFRNFGLHNPIAVIPNGISEAYLQRPGNGAKFRSRFQIDRDLRVALFLSRITPKKGLPMLIEALEAIKPSLKDWVFLIAGADEFGHEREMKKFVHKLGLEATVRFIGPLYGPDKVDAYAAADLFVLPSHSEGFPMVVLEALASAVPVLTTQSSPWRELIEHRCGWWTQVSVDGIANALSEALGSTPTELAAMGERGHELVRSDYTWGQMAARTERLYKWLLGQAPAPEFVVTN